MLISVSSDWCSGSILYGFIVYLLTTHRWPRRLPVNTILIQTASWQSRFGHVNMMNIWTVYSYVEQEKNRVHARSPEASFPLKARIRPENMGVGTSGIDANSKFVTIRPTLSKLVPEQSEP